MAEENDPVEQPELESPPRGGAKWLGVVKVVGFLAVVVAVELVVAIFVFPSAAETQAMADAMRAKAAGGDMLPVEPEPIAEFDEAEKMEVDLGEFHVASYQPLSNTTVQIDFHLFATVLNDDESKFKQLMEEKEQRVRDQVLTTVRSADMNDLTDAGLGLFKRKILDTTNRTPGQAVLQEIIFSDFSWVER